MSKTKIRHVLHPMLGLWIASIVLLISSGSLKFDNGVIPALLIASGSTGILSALYVDYLAGKHGKKESINATLLTITGIEAEPCFYVLIGSLTM
ncbi:hypothetical protein F7230_07875 [Corynebacterium sp. 320]|uniref:hypothetical protein n=1 Tax=Corynebacterium TaxID=1716 RepID=UPI00125CC026|nr:MULTISPECIES: hypothetical protein [Corynebacterium]KAB1502894.1 hypothetical protein F7230_07875 [Corynebacterium sp. 320]KAB1552405.1 hypothetical protein F7233_01195 [Corynebacterium sp. 321]KAB1554380.1 hypothetical protein F7232_05400 [Corynebacterium sp. 319]KAB3526557.1 hypothetical protein F8354_07875 [Corynebacterium sp. 250]KAB3539877.1 hypothetical protein F8390_00930 [Corynebacterium sp. 366]